MVNFLKLHIQHRLTNRNIRLNRHTNQPIRHLHIPRQHTLGEEQSRLVRLTFLSRHLDRKILMITTHRVQFRRTTSPGSILAAALNWALHLQMTFKLFVIHQSENILNSMEELLLDTHKKVLTKKSTYNFLCNINFFI